MIKTKLDITENQPGNPKGKQPIKHINLEAEINRMVIRGNNMLGIWIKGEPGCYWYKLKDGKNMWISIFEEEA